MHEDDLSYYRRRFDVEREQARQATRPEVATAHSQLADAYLERIASLAPVREGAHA